MDVNGTRFHLLAGPADWERLSEELEEGETSRVRYDERRGALTLAPLVFFFTERTGGSALDPALRRSAAADAYGAIWFIGEDRTSIWWLRPGQRHAQLYWTAPAADGLTAPGAEFTPVTPPPHHVVQLQGLTVTAHHYLVTGNPAGHELLAFDLHAGGAPVRMNWPAAVPFEPFDLEAAADGGLWVLDRKHTCYWRVDRSFQVVALDAQPLQPVKPAVGSDFAPAAPGEVGGAASERFPRPMPLDAKDPIALAALPDDTVLILYRTGGTAASAVVRYRAATRLQSFDLAERVPVAEDHALSIHAYDLAYVPTARPERGDLYVVESRGNQAFRFRADWVAEPPLELEGAYLPMQRHGGAELVVRRERVLYDVRDRWVELRPIDRPRYATAATLTSSALDGRELDCAWHRVLLDGCLPPGTTVEVLARVANDPADLAAAEWLRQPSPYRRGMGGELPHQSPVSPENDHDGTWELLLQELNGRWLQLRLLVHGTGRATPVLRALRIYYPRFSYLVEYLPRLYRDDPVSASFLERTLAAFEGMYATWEGRIEQVHRYFDAQAVPEDALDWLAGWLGVVVEPLWDTARKRLFVEHVMELYRWHGTPRGLLMALRLYLEPEPTRDIFAAAPPPARPIVRLVERFRTRRTGGAPQGVADASAGDVLQPLTRGRLEATAHRFVALVPDGLSRQQLEGVRRIIDLQKPAHTCYALDALWSLFRVGSARLELDTELGAGRCFRPLVTGAGYVGADTHLGYPHPLNVATRAVLDRDRLGGAPPL